MTATRRRTPEAAIWQDVESGAYSADLDLWRELAAEAGTAVVEFGAGSGRVALDLARAGHDVIAIEREPALSAELRDRWSESFGSDPGGRRARRLVTETLDLAQPLEPSRARAAELASATRLVIAPLHVIQMVPPPARAAMLGNAARMLRAGGLFAAVIVAESSLLLPEQGHSGPRPPDMRDVGGWIYSSEPLWVQVSGAEIRVRRLRKRVAPDGEIERGVHDELLHRLTPEQLEAEARDAGLSPAGRRTIASGPGEADSIAVLLQVPG